MLASNQDATPPVPLPPTTAAEAAAGSFGAAGVAAVAAVAAASGRSVAGRSRQCESVATPSPGMLLFQQGEAALRAHDRDRAYDYFRQAMAHINELDPVTAQRLQDHLQLLAAPNLREPGGPRADRRGRRPAAGPGEASGHGVGAAGRGRALHPGEGPEKRLGPVAAGAEEDRNGRPGAAVPRHLVAQLRPQHRLRAGVHREGRPVAGAEGAEQRRPRRHAPREAGEARPAAENPRTGGRIQPPHGRAALCGGGGGGEAGGGIGPEGPVGAATPPPLQNGPQLSRHDGDQGEARRRVFHGS